MAYTYKISRAGEHIQIVGSGEVDTADCIDIITRVITDPCCRSDSTAIIDLRNAVYLTKDRSEVMQIAHTLEACVAFLKNNIAIVASRGTLFSAELLARHVRDVAHAKIRVFVDLNAAEAFCREGTPLCHAG
ncbi:MAG: hypothetical protein WCI03_05075 [bacterium]